PADRCEADLFQAKLSPVRLARSLKLAKVAINTIPPSALVYPIFSSYQSWATPPSAVEKSVISSVPMAPISASAECSPESAGSEPQWKMSLPFRARKSPWRRDHSSAEG